ESFARLPNGANAAFYEQRTLQHDGVEAVTVLPRMNGIGTVGVIVSAAEGVDEQALLADIHADLQSVREIAVDVSVLPPTVRNVDVEIEIVPKRNVDKAEAAAAVETAVRRFFTAKLLGGSVYRAALGNAIYDTGMVENYVLLQPTADVQAQTAVLPKLHTLKVTEAEA
ncbi:MAG: baseplate J/gp47 family protein, partial [Oscillospiraceae bacterium]|nr:baseplate J/gp47 family protein [Oscillospiraceae bacterium]